jgi:hypothetical protein
MALKLEIEKRGDCKSKEEFFKNARRAVCTSQNDCRKTASLFKAEKLHAPLN